MSLLSLAIAATFLVVPLDHWRRRRSSFAALPSFTFLVFAVLVTVRGFLGRRLALIGRRLLLAAAAFSASIIVVRFGPGRLLLGLVGSPSAPGTGPGRSRAGGGRRGRRGSAMGLVVIVTGRAFGRFGTRDVRRSGGDRRGRGGRGGRTRRCRALASTILGRYDDLSAGGMDVFARLDHYAAVRGRRGITVVAGFRVLLR